MDQDFPELFELSVKGRFCESTYGNLLCFLNKHRHTEKSGDGGMLVAAGGNFQRKNPGGALTGRHACNVIMRREGVKSTKEPAGKYLPLACGCTKQWGTCSGSEFTEVSRERLLSEPFISYFLKNTHKGYLLLWLCLFSCVFWFMQFYGWYNSQRRTALWNFLAIQWLGLCASTSAAQVLPLVGELRSGLPRD